MKKALKIVSVFIILIVIFCVIELKPKVEIKTIALFSNVLNREERPVFMKLQMEQNVTGNGMENIIMFYAFDKDRICTKVDGESVSVGTIKNENGFYTLMHNDKLYVKQTNLDYSSDLSIFNDDIKNYDSDMFKVGEAEINGVRYNYEELENNGIVTRYYYSILNDRLEYLEINNDIIRILDYGNNLDNSIFEIPNDYKELVNID